MLSNRTSEKGFSLIEIAITLVIIALVITFGLPGFAEWSQNTQIRSAAESIQSGLQVARAEAVRRNTLVEFRLSANIGNAGGTGWSVVLASNTATAIQQKPDGEGSSSVVVSTLPTGSTTITFDGSGRAWMGKAGKNQDDTSFLTQIDLDSNAIPASQTQELTIQIDATGGLIRMCNPKINTTGDPRKCPYPLL